MARRLLPSVLTLFALLPAPASAQGKTLMASADSALFRGLRARRVGPSRGGRVTTVTGVPSQPRTFYMGVASGGVFRTTDGGGNWVAINHGQGAAGATGAGAGGGIAPTH